MKQENQPISSSKRIPFDGVSQPNMSRATGKGLTQSKSYLKVADVKCPNCGHLEDRVLDTRIGKDGESIRRRRECLKCRGRFTTVETLSQVYPLIIKKDGRREPFSKDKVLKGIQAACQKRPVSLAQMEQIVERVAMWVLSRPEREVTSESVGQKVVKELRLLDDVAYVRFASVYQTFQDVGEFVSHLESHHDDGSIAGSQVGSQIDSAKNILMTETAKKSPKD